MGHDYRQRVKCQNPEKYKQYLEKQQVKAKEQRQKQNNEINKHRPKKEAIEK